MALRFVKTAPITPACVLPCPLPTTPIRLTFPFTATQPGFAGVQGGPKLTLKAGCTDCGAAIDLFARVSPFILSLGIPLCAIQCAASLFQVVRDVVTISTGTVKMVTNLAQVPPEPPNAGDVTEVTDAVQKLTIGKPAESPPVPSDIAKALLDCKCLLDIFTPLGICSFVKFLRDLLRLFAALLNCLATLLGDILRIGLKFDLMLRSPVVRIREQGKCLGSIARSQLNRLTLEMDAVWTVLIAAGTVFSFIEKTVDTVAPGVYPAPMRLSEILLKVAEFRTNAQTAATDDINLVIPDCQKMKDIVFDMRDFFSTGAELLNQAASILCPL